MTLELYLKRHHHTQDHQIIYRLSPMSSSRSFRVLHFTFGSMIHFELIFVKGIRSVSRFTFVHLDVWLFQHPFFKKNYLFIFSCVGSSLLCAGFLQLRQAGATVCSGARVSHWGGFFCCGARALAAQASVVMAHGLSCSAACGILPDQGSNLCPLHWQADS